MMASRILCFAGLSVFAILPAPAQVAEPPSAFVSANAGGFVTTKAAFDRIYGSRLVFALGGALGLPLSPQSYLYGKVTYFSKTSNPATFANGSATFTQWIINAGAQQNFTVSHEFDIGVNGGLTYSTFSEEIRFNGSNTSSSVKGRGLLGLFVGVDLEHRIAGGPLSVFGEGQYNFAWPIISSLIGNYGGVNLTAGLRYYFKDSRRH
jgi:hypothetical protein